jgi:methionyl-tRNA synthetase
VHLIGKDILMTHAVYWSTMLMALELPLPQHIVSHGWWLNGEGKKMSKSEGEAVSPKKLIERFDVDRARYFLMKGMRFGQDAALSLPAAALLLNEDLADRYGNILSRVSQLVCKNFGGKVPAPVGGAASDSVKAAAADTIDMYVRHMEAFEPDLALRAVRSLLGTADKFINDMAPWKLVKDASTMDMAGDTLYTALEVLRIASILLSPVMPTKTREALDCLGWTGEVSIGSARNWGALPTGAVVTRSAGLFPKLEELEK